MQGRSCWLAVAFWLSLIVSLSSLSGFCQDGPSFSGDWSFDLAIEPAIAFDLDATSTLNLTYSVGGWDFSSTTTLDESGLARQGFDAVGVIGDIGLSSSLRFKGSSGFTRWSNVAGWESHGLSFSAVFEMTETYVSFSLSASGTVDDLVVKSDIELRSKDGCALLFSAIDISIDFPLCCTVVSADVGFTCDGFEAAAFSVYGIVVPNLPWLAIDADLSFTMDEKTLELSPMLDFGTFACIELYIDIEPGASPAIDEILIYGIGLECELGDVSFEALSYLDGTHKLNGHYWEMVALSLDSSVDCCGLTSMELAVYFLEGGLRLFDVASFEGSFSLALSEQLAFDMALMWDIEAGIVEEMTCGFEVSW